MKRVCTHCGKDLYCYFFNQKITCHSNVCHIVKILTLGCMYSNVKVYCIKGCPECDTKTVDELWRQHEPSYKKKSKA